MSRIAQRLFVLAVLGMLTACAIAWVFAMRTNVRGAPRFNLHTGSYMHGYRSPENGEIWLINQNVGTGVVEMSIGRAPMAADSPATDLRVERMLTAREISSWSITRNRQPADSLPQRCIEQAFGWPMLCLWQRHELDSVTERFLATNAIRVPREWRGLGGGQFLPTRPIWIGLLINTAIFAWLWFALFSCPGMVRKRIRKLKGRCPNCGYSLHAAISNRCPECGADN